ncbi:energy transducer TonB [Longitalea luteola]|uniref:energy transducer TonB n=1 Tax=Longitalea luteola TaxID=2812563 RepID=UPI001A95B60B|nr:energy transducer TonB [Longitalea luteola]
METSTILTADVLDILFDGRNKEYGAYDLRRTYNKRLAMSLTVMLLVTCMLFIGFAFAGKKTTVAKEFIIGPDVILEPPPPVEKEIKLPPPPAKQSHPPVQVQTLKVTPLRIVPDEQIPQTEMPPVEAQEHVKIGSKTIDGVPEGDLVIAPPGDVQGQGIIERPKKEDRADDGIFRKVEIESEYPGGLAAWQRFLYKNLRYPQEAVDQNIQGVVVVQFIVDKEGNVSDVEAVSGPQELQAEAIRVIRKSGKWTPAIQNGNKVKSYKKQPVGFRMAEE